MGNSGELKEHQLGLTSSGWQQGANARLNQGKVPQSKNSRRMSFKEKLAVQPIVWLSGGKHLSRSVSF